MLVEEREKSMSLFFLHQHFKQILFREWEKIRVVNSHPDGKYRDWSRRFNPNRFSLKSPTNIQGIDGDRLQDS